MPKNFALGLVLMGCLGLTACGGVDPNATAVAADVPTCKIKANWTKVHVGLSIQNVVNILGQPNSKTETPGSMVYTYEDCRIFVILETEDDPATLTVDETKYKRQSFPGTVTFNGPINGFVVGIQTPLSATDKVVYEYTDAEVIADRSPLF